MQCYQFNVSAQTLADNINREDWLVFDSQANPAIPEDGRQMYAGRHIPGAIHICLDTDLSAPVTEQSGRHPLPDPAALIKKLRDWGVNKNSQLVVYDSAGGVMAVRFWWTLRHWFGHQCVAILDGGLDAWQRSGQAVSAEEPPKRPPGDFDPTPNDKAWVSTEELEGLISKNKVTLLDARARERYRGDVEPVDAQAGHIPSAMCLPMMENLDDNKQLCSEEELRRRFAHINGPVVHSCASGVTACLNMLAMESVGLPPGRLHPGSWSEWIRDPKRKTATGDQPGEL